MNNKTAFLPPKIRYDSNLQPIDKLLFAELTTLIDTEKKVDKNSIDNTYQFNTKESLENLQKNGYIILNNNYIYINNSNLPRKKYNTNICIKTKYILLIKKGNNLYYTKNKLFTIDYTSNKTFFNSNNIKYRVLTNSLSLYEKYIILFTKEKNKENIKFSHNTNDSIKESKKENPSIQEIFDYYNSLGLKKMRTLNEKTIKAIKKALKEYTKEKLFEMMRRFKCIIRDEFYYYNYVWNVEEFFCRKDGYKTFDDDGAKWLAYINERPIVKTDKYFEAICAIYPNKNSPIDAKKEFQRKFVGIKTDDEALIWARKIYVLCKNYVSETEEQYVMTLGRWLRANI